MSAELTKEDLEILASYAEESNRELYFNFLAQKKGNDGYGLLALGVIRNDNAPGATANSFAARQARADGLSLAESDWQRFGVDLMRRDLESRQAAFDNGRPDLALNLPARADKATHDSAFRNADIDPSAWTPYKLLEAAYRHGGNREVEEVWKMLLDNNNRGLDRAVQTADLIRGKYHALIDDPEGYLRDMVAARLPQGVVPISNIDPDNVKYNGTLYHHAEKSGWSQEVVEPAVLNAGPLSMNGPRTRIDAVTDPAVLRYLDDAREVRQQREAMRDQFHPDDPNRSRPITPSPLLISDAQDVSPGMVQLERLQATIDFTQQGHPHHALWQQCCAGVREVDAGLGKPWDAHSASMAGSLTALAVSEGLQRVDHVVLSVQGSECAPGQNVFVVQGDLQDPAHLRASMPTQQACSQTQEQSFQQALAGERLQADLQLQQRTQEEQLLQGRNGPTLSM